MEVQSKENVYNIFEHNDVTPNDIVKEKGKRLIDNGLQRGNNGYSCDKCNAVYIYKGGLYTHVKLVHEGMKYDCNKCDYRATTQGNLECHIQSVHEGVKYDCNKCDYRATMQGSLTHHSTVQEGVKYDRNKCEYRGTRQSNLTCHIKSLYE